MVRNNEIEDIITVILTLEKRGILLKGTTEKLKAKNEDSLQMFLVI